MRVPVVGWTQAHVDHLNQMFPEIVDEADTNKLLINSGKRAVVRQIQQIVSAGRRQMLDEA